MKRGILLTHTFIDINQDFKRDIIDLCINHYRKNNPNEFIVLTGHGMQPYSKTLDLCDDFFWHPNILFSEINVGHPKMVNIGIDILKNKGYTKFCKSRADSIIMRPNILNYCENVLKDERRKLLITTTNNYKYYMGDLFLYGLLDFIKSCWKIDTWYPTNTGLESLGRNFLLALDIEPPKIWNVNAKLSGNSTWIDLLRTHTSYRDVENIKWIDLRGYWKEIFSINNYKEKLLNNQFPFKRFIWKSWPMERKFYPISEKLFYKF